MKPLRATEAAFVVLEPGMADAKRFVLLRGTPVGPAFLARPDQPDDADTWTEDRRDARRFGDRAEAEALQGEIVARSGIAVAVVSV